MNAFHEFAFSLILYATIWCAGLAVLRRVAGGGPAQVLEAIRGVIFWFVPTALFTVYSYLLQVTTLSKFVRAEIVGINEPWLAFLHEAVALTSPSVMAGLLVFLAAAGAFLVEGHAEHLQGLIALRWLAHRGQAALTAGQEANLYAEAAKAAFFVVAGVAMVALDARVFALRWAMDVAEIEAEARGSASIARLFAWAYGLGYVALAWIVHRKYTQFMVAAGIEGGEAPRQAVEQAEARPASAAPLPMGGLARQPTITGAPQPGATPVPQPVSGGRPEPATPVRPQISTNGPGAHGAMEPLPDGHWADALPLDGPADEVVPENLDPFGAPWRR